MSAITKLDPRHWRSVRRLFNTIRVSLFTSNAGSGRAQIEVDASLDEVREALGKRYFTNAWELSYHYEGEDLNMRRPEYVDDEYNWYQLHIRGFEQDDGTVLLYAHLELEPTEYPYEHLNGTNFSDSKGYEMMTPLLDDAGIEYEDIE